MRVVILAGGMGTRLQEETVARPKPMVEVGGMPILWHIMKHFQSHGFRDFVIALGYMGDFIKTYFLNRYNLSGHLSIDFASGQIDREELIQEDWRVRLVDTGLHTETGGRVKRLQSWLAGETFIVTYGDGLSNVDVHALVCFHRRHKRLATITAVRPPARFGGLVLDGDMVASFTEKPSAGEGWINGGYLVFEPEIFNYLGDDRSSLEVNTLERLAADSQLAAFQHADFWQCMDTLRDKHYLEGLWRNGHAPWRTWDSSPVATTCRAAWPQDSRKSA
ncbi:MAG: glucose-1-phosphate cytidylyltransferase [Pirellulaceae bacterium]